MPAVTCEAGHEIADLSARFLSGDDTVHFGPNSFENWRQPQPEIGAPEQRCNVCDGRWARRSGGELHPIQVHTATGWQTRADILAAKGPANDAQDDHPEVG
jgi:hypothetical protein